VLSRLRLRRWEEEGAGEGVGIFREEGGKEVGKGSAGTFGLYRGGPVYGRHSIWALTPVDRLRTKRKGN